MDRYELPDLHYRHCIFSYSPLLTILLSPAAYLAFCGLVMSESPAGGVAAELPAIGGDLGESSWEEPKAPEEYVQCISASNPICPEKICPSIASCEMKTTNEPIVWGPSLWHSLHIMAMNYPLQANEDHKKGCIKFLEGLPYMLPCGDCGSHLKAQYEAEGGSAGLGLVCDGRDTMNSFIVKLHNKVNKHLDKPQWTPKDASDKYSRSRICVKNGKTWDANTPLK